MSRPKMGNQLIQLLVPPTHVMWLKQLAKVQNTTVSEIVRRLVSNYVARSSKELSKQEIRG